jgi:hypothetical protein
MSILIESAGSRTFVNGGHGFAKRSMSERVPPSLLAPLADLGKWLAAVPADATIVGGVAVSLLSRPRFTQDIDALVILSETESERALRIAAAHGIAPRIDDALLAAHPAADLDTVRQWIREFATAAAMSELVVDFDKAVERRPKRHRP